MATYTKTGSDTLRLTEVPIYGSERIGMMTPNVAYKSTGIDTMDATFTRELGKRLYELKDHLGNVRATVSDLLIDHSGSKDAELIASTDYYPFGMIIPGRSYKASGTTAYRYGFNGKENDNEVKGEGGQQDYGFRIYDPRLAKFLSVDQLTREFPWYSPYQFAGNTPIQAIDIDGLEPVSVIGAVYVLGGAPKLSSSQWYVINGEIEQQSFSNAALNNTHDMNTRPYASIAERHNYYVWASYNAKQKDLYWFGAAADVTSQFMVGAADHINVWYVKDNTEDFLRTVNEQLFDFNMRQFGAIATGEQDLAVFGIASGKAIDGKMVQVEQTALQGFIDEYRKNFIDQNGKGEWDKIAENVNGLFKTDPLSDRLIPRSTKYALEKFENSHKGEGFDFMKQDHREFLGNAMAEYLRNNKAAQSD